MITDKYLVGCMTGFVLGMFPGLWIIFYLGYIFDPKASDWWSVPFVASLMCLLGLIMSLCATIGIVAHWFIDRKIHD